MQSVHVLEGMSSRVQLVDPNERAAGTVEVVIPESNQVAKAKWLSSSLVKPGRLLEGSTAWMQLVDPVSGSKVVVQPVHIVVQDPDWDGKGVGRALVESINSLEGACRSGMELADTVVGGKMVSHGTDGGRPVGETVARGKEPGLGAPLANDVERPAPKAGRLEAKPGNSRPGRGEATGSNKHVASD